MNIKVLVGFLLVLVLWDSVNCQAVPDVARPLPLTAVRITGGPLRHAQDLDRAYLLRLEPDRMMAYYRKRAGLQPKAQGYPGWDGDGRNLTGHIAGHYLSAVSLMFAATGDARFKERADYIVREMKEVQDKNGDGYLGAVEGLPEKFNDVANGNIKSSFFDLNVSGRRGTRCTRRSLACEMLIVLPATALPWNWRSSLLLGPRSSCRS